MSSENQAGSRTSPEATARVLLLAGTAEARALSLAVRGVELVTSLAGVTEDPARYGGTVRRGGFGGVAGLARYLQTAGIAAVVDATHPFAAQMTAHAVAACGLAHVPLLRLERPAWVAGPQDDWHAFDSVAAAVAALPAGAVGFVAAGRSASALEPGPSARLVLRMIEAPGPLAPEVQVIRARPPFSVEDEVALFEARGITHLLCKNAGGGPGRTKLDAARRLGLPVHMVARPRAPECTQVETVAAARAWLDRVAKPTGDAANSP
ncbi:MAG: cobalt-precorrin-6A reductase [Pseudomonadota bacterium]